MTTTSTVPALRFQSVNAAYGVYRALFDVSFDVARGTVKALLGSNGAGKSTVSRVATGLVATTSGSVSVVGTDVTGKPTFQIARRGVAHVPEGRGIFSDLSVEENLILLFRQRAGKKRVNECLIRAYDAFPILMTRRKQKAGQLSGGQQRVLSLANVLVVPPTILIADELSLGLAPLVVDAVYDGLSEIHRAGCALLVVEQQVDRVLDIADDALVLEHGTVAYDGPAKGAVRAIEGILAARGETKRLSPDVGHLQGADAHLLPE